MHVEFRNNASPLAAPSPVGAWLGLSWACCHCSNFDGSSATNRMRIQACCVPQNSEHWPMKEPGLSACNQMWLGWPGTLLILRVNFGTQNSCKTSFDSSRTDKGLPLGMWISLAVTTPEPG